MSTPVTRAAAVVAALAVVAVVTPAAAGEPRAQPQAETLPSPTGGQLAGYMADAAGDFTAVATVIDPSGAPRFVPVTADTPLEAQRAAQQVPGVVEVTPDTRAQLLTVSNDTYRASMWAIQNMMLDHLPAVDLTGIKVAVVDSGVRASHEDFAPGQVRCDLGLDNTGEGLSTNGCVDPHGHGTHVAGTVGAVKGNGKGVFGVAPGVEIIPIRSLNKDGYGWTSDIANGIRHAVEQGAHVINLSIGGVQSSLYDDAVAYAISKNVLVVAAAGNNRQSGNTPSWPASAPGAVSVAATDKFNVSSNFSYTGPEVDIAAPGLNIYNLYRFCDRRKMKLVGYIRVSTAGQVDDGLGLDVQRQAVEAWAQRHGHELTELIADEGISGTRHATERPGLARALDMIREGAAEGIVVHRLDRLARLLAVQEATLASVWAAGGRVFEAVGGEVLRDDPDDPMRTAMRQMLGVFGQLERATVVARMAAGRRLKAERGGYSGGAPRYGWVAQDRALVPSEPEQRVLERLIELRHQGLSWRAAARQLGEEGHRPKRAQLWHPETLRRMVDRLQQSHDGPLAP